MLGTVIVLNHLGVTALEVEDAVGGGALFAEHLDDTLGVGLGWVLALEDIVEIFGDHGCDVLM